MSKKSLVDSIEIKSPCSESWEAMSGNAQMRFCSHCEKSVNNLSEMTRKQAMRLVRDSNGRICVRYGKNPVNNQPIFAEKLYQITRRAGIAAGVLGASLAFSTLTYAQGKPVLVVNDEPTISEVLKNTNKTESATGIIEGTITDENGAVIPNVSVALTNVETKNVRTVSSDENGFYEFRDVEAGTHNINFVSVGFKTFIETATVSETRTTVISPVMEGGMAQNIMMGFISVSVNYKSALHQAVSNDGFEQAKMLITNGANVNQKDENYNNITPIFLAVENGNVEMVEYLLNFGAKVNVRDDNKQTPLMRLDGDASAELVRLLISRGAKVNTIDAEGNTPLILATNYANADVLQVLLAHGAGVNAQNKEGKTALMNAAENDKVESVRVLLLAGADVNLKNKEGDTAWSLTSNDEIETLLETYGAKTEEN